MYIWKHGEWDRKLFLAQTSFISQTERPGTADNWLKSPTTNDPIISSKTIMAPSCG